MTSFTLRLEFATEEESKVFGCFDTINEVYDTIQMYRKDLYHAHIQEISRTKEPIFHKIYRYYSNSNAILYDDTNGRHIKIIICSSEKEREREREIIHELFDELRTFHIEIPSQIIMVKSLMNIYYKKKGSLLSLSSLIGYNFDYIDTSIEKFTSFERYIEYLKKVIQKRKITLQLLQELTEEWRVKANFTGEDSELVDKKYYYAVDEPEIAFDDFKIKMNDYI
jgi:hypothetical protein